MDVSTAIALLTVNVIVLSVVILALIIIIIVLLVKLNKIASNVQQTSANIASATEWFSPMKIFSEIAKVVSSIKKR